MIQQRNNDLVNNTINVQELIQFVEPKSMANVRKFIFVIHDYYLWKTYFYLMMNKSIINRKIYILIFSIYI